MYQISDEDVKIFLKNMICLFKADESKLVASVSAAAPVFAEATPRQVRQRSKSLGLRFGATTPQDDVTRLPHILRHQ